MTAGFSSVAVAVGQRESRVSKLFGGGCIVGTWPGSAGGSESVITLSVIALLSTVHKQSINHRFITEVKKVGHLVKVVTFWLFLSFIMLPCFTVKSKGSPYSITESRVPELIPVSSQPALT